MFSLLCQFVLLVVSNLGFDDSHQVLVSPVPDHCFLFLVVLTQYCVIEFFSRVGINDKFRGLAEHPFVFPQRVLSVHECMIIFIL